MSAGDREWSDIRAWFPVISPYLVRLGWRESDIAEVRGLLNQARKVGNVPALVAGRRWVFDKLAVMPFAPLPIDVPRGCDTCQHRYLPGLSTGLCGADREDLPPAYGSGHPLRAPPPDRGIGCGHWEPRWAYGEVTGWR